MKRALASCAAAALAAAGCPAPAPPVSSNVPAPPLAGATTVVDQAKCETEDARLRPFVITWDVTQQASFSGQAQKSIAVVKLHGCNLELLDTCQIDGAYRPRDTPAATQTLSIADEDQLYASIPLGVASLGGHLKTSGSLELTYSIRGMSYATAPALYRSQLGAGCDGATHFVLNYAIGAYSVGTAKASGADVSAGAFGAAAGGSTSRSSSALFKGGDVDACAKGSAACDSPVRLRLVPITDGAPPEELAQAAAVAAKAAPTAPSTASAPLQKAEIGTSVKLGRPAMTACYQKELATNAAAAGRMNVKFAIGGDGFVSQVDTDVTGKLDPAIESCIRDVFYSLRFRAAGATLSVVYPLIFTSEDDDKTAPAPPGAFGAVAGTWQGGMKPESGAATPITIVLEPDAPAGAKVGSIDYPSLGCTADLVRVGTDAGELRVRETMVRGACTSGRMLRLEPMPDEPGTKALAIKLTWLGAGAAVDATGAVHP
jgi:hypothetical protein